MSQPLDENTRNHTHEHSGALDLYVYDRRRNAHGGDGGWDSLDTGARVLAVLIGGLLFVLAAGAVALWMSHWNWGHHSSAHAHPAVQTHPRRPTSDNHPGQSGKQSVSAAEKHSKAMRHFLKHRGFKTKRLTTCAVTRINDGNGWRLTFGVRGNCRNTIEVNKPNREVKVLQSPYYMRAATVLTFLDRDASIKRSREHPAAWTMEKSYHLATVRLPTDFKIGHDK